MSHIKSLKGAINTSKNMPKGAINTSKNMPKGAINTSKNMLSGLFFENYVANTLTANDIKLFYWRGKQSAELEFIVESNNKLFPIDAKKGRGTLNSLNKFANHNKFKFAIKVSKNNYGYDETQKILTIPFYYLPFVAKELGNATLA